MWPTAACRPGSWLSFSDNGSCPYRLTLHLFSYSGEGTSPTHPLPAPPESAQLTDQCFSIQELSEEVQISGLCSRSVRGHGTRPSGQQLLILVVMIVSCCSIFSKAFREGRCRGRPRCATWSSNSFTTTASFSSIRWVHSQLVMRLECFGLRTSPAKFAGLALWFKVRDGYKLLWTTNSEWEC
jgi:hypothetical protein